MIGVDDSNLDNTASDPLSFSIGCSLCKLGMKGFDKVFASKTNTDILETLSVLVCDMVVNKTVCKGVIKEMGDVLVPVITQSLLEPDYFCSEFLGACSNSGYYVFQAEQYVD